MTGDGETGPSGTDRLTPQRLRRIGGPVGGEFRAGHFAVSCWPEKLWEREIGQGMGPGQFAWLGGRLAISRGEFALGPAPLKNRNHISAELAEPKAAEKNGNATHETPEHGQSRPLGQAREKQNPDQQQHRSDDQTAEGSQHLHLVIIGTGVPDDHERDSQAGANHHSGP